MEGESQELFGEEVEEVSRSKDGEGVVEEWGGNRRWSGGACHSESGACLLFNRH